MMILTLEIFLLINLSNKVQSSIHSPQLIEKYDGKYLPNWKSLDSRPLPSWFDDAKVGIFLHWGVFSVPSFSSEWFWSNWKGNSSSVINFMENNYPPNYSYQEFAKDLTAEFFNPDDWASLFKNSGARYIVLTSKHHEGFTLWPSKYSYSWNSVDIGPHRDLVGDLANAVRKAGLTFGLYHSLYEWYNPLYLSDKATNFTKKDFVDKKMIPEMIELVENYKPNIIWSDGDWEAEDTYFKSKEFLSWLYNDSPVKDTVVVNDRWGKGIPCKHGGYYSCADRFNPGELQDHKWENAMTIDKKSWGYRRNMDILDILTSWELIKTMAETVSCGGNILINVGPTKDGVIAPIFQERLLDLGKWLSINGEAIYGSSPWTAQNDTRTPGVWYTSKGSTVFAIVLNWPTDNKIELASLQKLFVPHEYKIFLLGNENQRLKWSLNSDFVSIQFPDKATVKSNLAWILKIYP